MSRQHVIPKGFINNMNFKALTVWLDKASSKVINSELMVKDVCAECNNGELSQLDAYALKLIISYNEKILYLIHHIVILIYLYISLYHFAFNFSIPF